MFGIIVQEGEDECGDELGVVYHVKILEKVNHHGWSDDGH